jgi:HK97 family phage major capsid protein
MPILKTEDVQSWTKEKVDTELKSRLDDVASIREKNGGTLVGVKGADADLIKEHLASTNVLGERRDAIQSEVSNEEHFARLEEYLKDPDPAAVRPFGKNGGGNRRAKGPQDIGALFTESEAWKAFKESGSKDVEVELPVASLWGGYEGIGEMPGSGMRAALYDSTDFPIQPDFRPAPVDTLFQQNNIGPLMPQGSTNSNAIRTVKETVTASGAAAVAEGGTKPEADITFSSVDEPVRKLAVTLPLTDESLEDTPFMRAYLNARLRLFIENEEDRQLLVGSGVSPNLTGIMNRSGINTTTSYSIGGANPDQALIDAVFKAAMRVRDAFLEPDAAVMKPATWEIAALAKDGNRNYLLGGPGRGQLRRRRPGPAALGTARRAEREHAGAARDEQAGARRRLPDGRDDRAPRRDLARDQRLARHLLPGEQGDAPRRGAPRAARVPAGRLRSRHVGRITPKGEEPAMAYKGGYPSGTGIKFCRARYDFAVDGGAIGTITISAENLPVNAIILGGLVEVDTAVTSGGAATVAVQAEAAGDLVAAAAVSGAPWSTTGRKSVIPAFTGATTLKTTQARPVQIVIAAAALTAGAFDVFLAYIDLGD